jgi:hypothetical protein
VSWVKDGHRLEDCKAVMAHRDAYPNPWFYNGLPSEMTGLFVSMWEEGGDVAGRARLMQSHREWLGRIERGEIEGLAERALGLFMVDLVGGAQGVLFEVGGRDGLTATFGEIQTGDVRSVPGDHLCPIELPDGDSGRPAFGHWYEPRRGWFLAHRGYVDEEAYGHLRNRRKDDGVPRAVEELCSETGLDPRIVASGLGGSIVRRVHHPLVEERFLLRHGDEWDHGLDAGGQFQLTVGDEGEVVITVVAPGLVEVAEYAATWLGAGELVPYRRDRGLVAVRMTDDPERESAVVAAAIRSLRRSRRRRFRRCVSCQEMVPPEWWFGEGLCYSCASRDLGVVY